MGPAIGGPHCNLSVVARQALAQALIKTGIKTERHSGSDWGGSQMLHWTQLGMTVVIIANRWQALFVCKTSEATVNDLRP